MTSTELARRAGMSVQHLNRLVREGLAEPSGRLSRKQGSPADWSEEDVAIVTEMVAARRSLTRLGRCRVPPIRLRALGTIGVLAVGGAVGAVVRVTRQTTVAQLLRLLGGACAILPGGP